MVVLLVQLHMTELVKSSSLSVFLFENKLKVTEGYVCPVQKNQIKEIFKKNKIKSVLEIGFNAGHSADCFLSQGEDVTLTSVDIAKHQYVLPCVNYISDKYKDRFKFMIGDSRYTVPEITNKFDFIFIDGGHSEEIAYADILNCKQVAKPDTLVMLDDYCQAHGLEVMKAFEKAVKEGIIRQIETAYRVALRGWVLYKYV